jgi:long-chain acyl-CoA synthetase
MMEYFNEPEETSNVLKAHIDGRIWLHTGDMGHMDQDGFVYFKQRIKRIIKSSGYSVFPTQIETVINKHDSVVMCCVIGVPDEYQIEKIKAFVVLKEGYEESEELRESILNLCRSYLAKWSTPRELEFRKELPLTKVGKIAYTVLEQEVRSGK